MSGESFYSQVVALRAENERLTEELKVTEAQMDRNEMALSVAEAQVAAVRALGESWKSLGTTSVYESAQELGEQVIAALDGGQETS